MGGEGDYSRYRRWRGEGEGYAEEVRRVLLIQVCMVVCTASDVYLLLCLYLYFVRKQYKDCRFKWYRQPAL